MDCTFSAVIEAALVLTLVDGEVVDAPRDVSSADACVLRVETCATIVLCCSAVADVSTETKPVVSDKSCCVVPTLSAVEMEVVATGDVTTTGAAVVVDATFSVL